MRKKAEINQMSGYLSGILKGLKPEIQLTVSEWADKYRMLDTKGAALPGKWRTSHTPYLREIMDHLSPSSPMTHVIVMKGAQIGFTEAALNMVGAVIDSFPGPMLLIYPTLEVAERTVKQRINPMIQSTPRLRKKFAPEEEGEKKGDALLLKNYPGGVLIVGGAGSPASLASIPVRYVILDERDRMEQEVKGEGDPGRLAERRTNTYGKKKKIFVLSTPAEEGTSQIAAAFEKTDQRYFHLPCPHCGHAQHLRWPQIKWQPDDPGEVWYECEADGCKKRIEEWQKTDMMAKGVWRALSEGRPLEVGYHLNALYSPVGGFSWAEAVKEFLDAKNKPELFKTWVNTVLGEVWVPQDEEKMDWRMLSMRRQDTWEYLPPKVLYITCGVDVQKEYLQLETVGWGENEESWSLDWKTLEGNPIQPEVWYKLDEYLKRTWMTKEAQHVGISATCIDSGYLTDYVCQFVASRKGQNVFATKGMSSAGQPVVGLPSTANKWGVPVYKVGTDTLKLLIFRRLQISDKGAGYCHFPSGRDSSFFKSLLAEKMTVARVGNVLKTIWKQIYERNEAIDCRGLSVVALKISNPTFAQTGLQTKEEMAMGARFKRTTPATATKTSPAPRTQSRRVLNKGIEI